MQVGATGARSVAAVALFSLFTLMAVIIGWMALPACGFSLPGIGQIINSCTLPPTTVIGIERSDRLATAVLQEEVLQLERQLAQAPSCPVPANGTLLHGARQDLAACPVQRSDNVALLVDASSSMKWSFTLDPELERRASNSSLSQGERSDAIRQILETPGTPRMDVARQALKQLSDAADASVSFDLISFAQCGSPNHRGKFSPADRARLNQAIDTIVADNATALAEAILALPRLLPGNEAAGQKTNVVLVSDGYDSCGGDPCAAATALRQMRPDISINVVAMSRSIEQLRCVSDATGGQFLQPDGVEELAPLLRTASGQDAPAHCR